MKIIEGVKKSALAGMILNSYISLLKWFKPKDREQISKLEDLHKEWFSVAELREAVGGFFEKKKIPLYLVEESEKDKDAYDKVYLEFIGARGVEIKDKSPEEVKLINKSFTLEKFVRETYLNDYKKHIDTGKDNVTTLTGIFEKRLPQKKDKGSFNKNKKSSFKMPDIFSFFGK